MITEPDNLEELEKLEGKKNKAPSVAAKSRKRSNIQNKSTKRKKEREEETSSSSFSEECETDLSDASSEENASGSENLIFDEELDDEEMLKNFWAIFDILNKRYACVYQIKNKLHLFIAKSIERFLHDENGPLAALSINSLKPPIGSGNVLESIPSHLPCDIGVFPFQDIFYGPTEVLPMKNGRWSIPELSKIRDAFEKVINIDRNTLSQVFYASAKYAPAYYASAKL